MGATHTVTSVQVGWLVMLEKELIPSQGPQKRSEEGEGGVLTKEPGAHVLKGLHCTALALMLKLPSIQGVHTRSEDAVALAVT